MIMTAVGLGAAVFIETISGSALMYGKEEN